jgi:hypothetical protein
MTPIDIRRIREARRLAAARRRPSVLWPVGRPELAALVDLGMSHRQQSAQTIAVKAA